MKKRLKSTLLGLLCASTALSALPPEALAGPMSVASPDTVGLTAPIANVHYYRRYWGHRHWGWHRPHYYRWGYYRPYRWGYYRPWGYYHPWGYYRPWGYRTAYYPYYGGYDPSGAIFASAALGLMGAGIAAATAPRWGWGWGPGWGWGGWGGWGGGWW